MLFLKIHFGIDGSATVHTSIETTLEREPKSGLREPDFIAQLKDAVELKLVRDNAEISLPGFPPTTLADIRKAWDF